MARCCSPCDEVQSRGGGYAIHDCLVVLIIDSLFLGSGATCSFISQQEIYLETGYAFQPLNILLFMYNGNTYWINILTDNGFQEKTFL